MALEGTIRFYEQHKDFDAEPIIIPNVTIPDIVEEDHQYYEQRGETIDVEEYPEVEVLVQEENNVYVIIEMCALHLIDFIRDHENSTVEKYFNVQYKFRVYQDKETRTSNLYNSMMEIEGDTVHISNISKEDLNNKNLLAFCYDHLKQRRGCEDLVDA